jgi:hypothetical protein
VRTVASEFGIESDLADGPALALGASESTLLEMTGAYSGILNGGSAVRPYGLQEVRIVGDERPLLEQRTGLRDRVISEDAARQLTYMMSRAVASAPRSAPRCRGGRWREDRHHPGRARRVVPRLHRRLRGRGLDGVRRQHAAFGRDRRWPAGGDLAPDHGAHPRGSAAAPLADDRPGLEARPPQVIEYLPGGQQVGGTDPDPVESFLMEVLGSIFGQN